MASNHQDIFATPVNVPRSRIPGSNATVTTPTSAQKSNFSSPGHRRLNSVKQGTGLININDDASEKKKKKLEAAQKRSSMQGGSEEYSEHYSYCLQLSAQNKINAKNAFNLHLIDLMDKLLLKKSKTDFQLASSILEASAKIYNCRVDVVYTEVCKLLNNLKFATRGDANGDDDDEDQDDIGEADENGEPGMAEPAKRTKKNVERKKKKTIVTNLKKITLDKIDTVAEFDPIFRKTMETFEVGGTESLLLNTLSTYDDSCELVWNSKKDISGQNHKQNPDGGKLVDISDFQGIFKSILDNKPKICPSFTDFKWLPSNKNGSFSKEELLKYRFDRKESCVHSKTMECPRLDLSDDDGHSNDFPFIGSHDHSDDDNDVMPDIPLESSGIPSLEKTIALAKKGDMSALKQALLDHPSEYSFFKDEYIRAWTNPNKWKELARRGGPKTRAKRKPREPFFEKFEDENIDEEGNKKKKKKALTKADLMWHFQKSDGPTAKKPQSLLQNDPLKLLLPVDLYYDPEDLRHLYFMKGVRVEPSKNPVPAEVNNYNYNNTNDVNNYCSDERNLETHFEQIRIGQTQVEGGGGNHGDNPVREDDDDNDVGGDDDMGGCDDFGGGEAGGMNDGGFNPTPFDDFTQTQTGDAGEKRDGEVPFSEDLVPMPRMIPRTQIDYDKVPKRVDVKILKNCMLSAMNQKFNSGDESLQFSHISKSIFDRLPRPTRDDMSFPIAVVCLLILANEENLSLESTEDLRDIVVSKE